FVLLRDCIKYLRIEQIMTDPSFHRRGVGSSLISYVNNIYFRTRNYLKAGTQFNNKQAMNFYKKNKFYKDDILFYQHIYSN
ncbi:GNAT family N-acetyltransferase, partial [Candidatus Pelagibacter sp.]|nr:GNAT family N-acetyltransferase [Candidatus Pelagibacter sp.]